MEYEEIEALVSRIDMHVLDIQNICHNVLNCQEDLRIPAHAVAALTTLKYLISHEVDMFLESSEARGLNKKAREN